MFKYSIRQLRSIQDSYETIYSGGIEFRGRRNFLQYVETNSLRLAEYKADFDQALKHIGCAKKDLPVGWERLKMMRDWLNGENKEIE